MTVQFPQVDATSDSERSPLLTRVHSTEFLLQLFVFLIGTALATFFLNDLIFDTWSLPSDVAQHSYWMVTYHDAQLFPGDLYVKYARSLSTPGLQLIYYIGTFLFSPVAVGKILTITLFGATGWLYYLIGRAYGGRLPGLLMAFFFLHFPNHIDQFEGGIHRAFMHPLIALFFWAMVARKLRWCLGVLAVALFIYPLAMLICAVTLAFFVLLRPAALRRVFLSRTALIGLALLAVAAGALYAQRVLYEPDFLGRMVTGHEMAEDPRFTLGGRSEYLPFRPLDSFLIWYIYQSNDTQFLLFYLVPVYFLFQLARGRSIWREIAPPLALILASIGLYLLAKKVHFHLYIPGRYLQFSPVLFGCVLATLGTLAIIQLIRQPAAKLAAVIVIAAACFHDVSDTAAKFVERNHRSSRDDKRLLLEIGKLPQDTLIAADPDFSDTITVFSHRSTLLKYELSHPWFLDYRAMVEQRARDYYALVYADNLTQLKAIRDKYGIDVIIFDPDYYDRRERDEEELFYEPLNAELQYKFPVDDTKEYLVEELAKRAPGFQWNRYELLPLDDSTLNAITGPPR